MSGDCVIPQFGHYVESSTTLTRGLLERGAVVVVVVVAIIYKICLIICVIVRI